MAANGNSGNTGTATSASQAQSQAAAGNAAASNAANSGTGNTSGGNTSTNTSTSNNATNSAGLMGSLIGFGNAVTGNVGNTYGGSGDGRSDSNLSAEPADTADKSNITLAALRRAINSERKGIPARSELPANAVAKGDEAYTKARAEGKTEAEAQLAARNAVRGELNNTNQMNTFNKLSVYGFKAENTGPTYNPSVTAQATTNPTIAKGSSEMGPSAPAASTAPAAPSNTAGPAAGSTSTESAAPSTNDAANTGITNRGSTVANGGTSVTDSGTGGSVSSSITPPSRDASSIGLGVYNTDRANYDQDNWNRGMESESSSLVSDEECKAFAKRAFMENSEPFKRVRVTIIKKC